MITRFALALAIAACGMPPEILPATTGEESTNTGENSTGEDSTTSGSPTTDTSGTGVEPSTSTGAGTESASGTGTTGTTSVTETTDTGTTGDPPGTCPGSPDDCLATGVWCVDLALFCVKAGIAGQSPNFCEGLNIVCATGEVDPCEVCAGLVEQCGLHNAAMPCEDIAVECACLAA